MAELDLTIRLAEKVLDDASMDPDSNLSMLSRQFLRSREEIDRLRTAMELAERCHLEQATQWKIEIDRLRAELVRSKWIEKTSKDVVADNDRLRAELEEKNSVIRTMDGGIERLRKDVLMMIEDRAETFHTECRRQAAQDILNNARTILAKTAKEEQ